MSELRAQTTNAEDLSTIEIAGYLSAASGPALETAFAEAQSARRILIVFQPRDFVNSAGIAVLFDLVLAAKERGAEIRVAHPAAHFRKVFRIMGLSADVDIFASTDEALQGWG